MNMPKSTNNKGPCDPDRQIAESRESMACGLGQRSHLALGSEYRSCWGGSSAWSLTQQRNEWEEHRQWTHLTINLHTTMDRVSAMTGHCYQSQFHLRDHTGMHLCSELPCCISCPTAESCHHSRHVTKDCTQITIAVNSEGFRKEGKL
jgi:hypothetical protein